jgi:2-oxoglutarate ferredoxin oxidoreductase subunit beta
MSQLVHPLEKFVRPGMASRIWCSGCSDGIVLNEFLRAIDELGLDTSKMVVVSGIGCAGRASGYMNVDAFHATHGRAIPVAVGIKVARPDLNVVVISGDGDLFSIGGNHFLHAARRNVGVKVICINNFNYGMTGGQAGPTTPLGAHLTTAPYGNIENPINLVQLAAAVGAVYVARWTAFHIRRIKESIKKSLAKKGFTFVEVVGICPEQYGRRQKMPKPIDMMMWFKKNSVISKELDPSKAEFTPERIVVGEFVDAERPEYTELMREQVNSIIGRLEKEGRLTNAEI